MVFWVQKNIVFAGLIEQLAEFGLFIVFEPNHVCKLGKLLNQHVDLHFAAAH